ncbi:hypothetical protein CDAR_216141 [Caerostris darwini]|uniref:Uncharacterized protein n=1 Tax=Caerostris darwini TaxID=1538125 RepID=A0AAV4SNZ7_9ARAC|nr:hypothetical protein CDAR_216141 [Caerostris darwini]
MKRLFDRNHYASSLSYLGLWEVLITVSSIGHHYCHARRLHRCFLISSLHFPFGSANDFRNKKGAGQAMDEQVQVSCYLLPFRPIGGWDIVKLEDELSSRQ